MTSATAAADRSFDRILARLQGVRRSGPTQATALCPAHGNTQTPALSVTYRPDERCTLIHCFSQDCTRADVLAALGLQPWEAYDDPPQPCEICGKNTIPDPSGRYVHDTCRARRDGQPVPSRRAPKSRRPGARQLVAPERIATRDDSVFDVVVAQREVARFEHIDAAGEVVAYSVRLEELRKYPADPEPRRAKDFYQKYTNGRGGWRSTKPDGLIVPIWRLHEVRDAIRSGRRVWLNEGHKAALAVEEAGGVATTVIAGDLTVQLAEDLRGGDVAIITDRDAAGYRKAAKAAEVLAGCARTVTVWQAATTGRGDDAYDHLAAGYTLDQLVEIPARRLPILEVLAAARENGRLKGRHIADLAEIVREADAWWQRYQATEDPTSAADARAKAQSWALIGGDHVRWLLQLRTRLESLPGVEAGDVAEVTALIADSVQVVAPLYEMTAAGVDEDLADVLMVEDAALDGQGEDTRPDAAVLSLPVQPRPAPAHIVPMSDRNEWRYDDGTNTGRRGVFMRAPRTSDWTWMAPLPFVHARIVKRDGRGHRAGTSYLLSSTADARPMSFNLDALRSGSWANVIGLDLSFDPKVIQAAAGAITKMAQQAPERERTPRLNPDTGRVELPVEPLDQYGDRPIGISDAEGLGIWRTRIVPELETAPKLAHLLGASAIAPFLVALGIPAHVFNVQGAQQQGKSIGMRLAAGLWGDSTQESRVGSLFGGWNVTRQGLGQWLSELGVMPTFRDEAGMTGFDQADWARIIYEIGWGMSRARPDLRSDSVRLSAPFTSILFTSSNAPLTAKSGGKFRGVPRRFVELGVPITVDQDQAIRLYNDGDSQHDAGWLNQCYGIVGPLLLEMFSVADARTYLSEARTRLVIPDGEIRDPAKFLVAHVAGAMMLDEILQTGGQVGDAAVEAVQTYIDEWSGVTRDGQRLLDLVMDLIATTPAAWPTKAEYEVNQESKSSTAEVEIAQRGIRPDVMGFFEASGSIIVLPPAWKYLQHQLELDDLREASAELVAMGVLRCTHSAHKTGTYQTVVKLRFPDGRERGVRGYRLVLPDLPCDEDADEAPIGPVTAPQLQGLQVTPPPVTGSEMALTRPVTGVTGVTGEILARDARAREGKLSAPAEEDAAMEQILDRSGTPGTAVHTTDLHPCLVCGKPCGVLIDTLSIHTPCWQSTTRTDRARRMLALHQERWLSLGQPWPACAVCGEPASQSLAGLALHAGECAEEFTRQEKPHVLALPAAKVATSAPVRTVVTGERFISDSVVLDVDAAWLGDGSTIPTPTSLGHVGDLVEWVVASRIGFGGTRDHRPEPGHVWLTPAMCAQLGLPHTGFDTMSEAEQQLAAMRTLPWFTDAAAAGWTITGAADKPWIKIYRGPAGAALTGISWGNGRYDEITAGDPTPEAFAQRLGLLCRSIGYPYTVTPAVTGVNAIAYSTSHGLPAVTIPDVAYNDVAANPSWFHDGALEEFLAEHGGRGFAHVFDRRKSYLASAGNAMLGSGPADHHRDGCQFDRKQAGLYRIAPLSAQPLPWLDGYDVRNPLGMPDASGWVSSASLGFLSDNQVPFTILEAYTWPAAASSTQLKGWQARMRQAADTLEQLAGDGDDNACALTGKGRYSQTHTGSRVASFKGVYADGIGRLAATDGRDPLQAANRYYPHWRAEIISYHTINTLRAVQRNHDRHQPGVVPVAIGNTDAVVYLGMSTDPGDVWPGQGPDSLANPALGKFKPAGYIDIARWLEAIAANEQSSRPVSRLRLIAEVGTTW